MSTPNNYQKVNLSKKSNQIDNILSKTIKQMKFNSNLSDTEITNNFFCITSN